MKPVKPRNFYITDWAMADERCKARMENMMRGFGQPASKVQVIAEDEIEALVRKKDWVDLDIRQGRVPFTGDPDVVFNRFKWTSPEETKAIIERHEILKNSKGYTRGFLRMLYGCMDFFHLESGKGKRDQQVMCWQLYDLHSAYGCFHKCRYCRRGRVTTLMLNIEDFLDHVDDLMAKNPWQKVFRYDVETDCLIIEPEYGMCRALVEHYAKIPDRYIILFSKSDNIDFLLDLEHKGHTIMLWTMSTPTVSRQIERDTATTEQRIEAARKCQEAGYTVRFKFKPIIPIAKWREEATDTLEKLFAAVTPDNLSMEMLFFDKVAEFKELFDMSLFDPAFIKMMEEHEASGKMTDHMHPMPDDFREEVYTHYMNEVKRLSPNTRLSLCAETQEMWKRLGPKLGMNGKSFACNCSPIAVPGVTSGRVTTTDDGYAVLDGQAAN
ncbi:MAG: spore photoproduct lyase family protein [Planctomycetota bacterium]